MTSLGEQIDALISSGEWYGINIFAGVRGEGPRVHLLRNISTAVPDQCTDPGAPASERLRQQLQNALNEIETRPDVPPFVDFDDVLG